MLEGPRIAAIAALIGDPARANMLTALMDGRALTASELAQTGGVTLQTASGHLGRMVDAGLLIVRKQGRHRYFALSESDVAGALEALMSVAQRMGAVPMRTGPRHSELRLARVCYDHLAGEQGVALLQGLQRRDILTDDTDPALTPDGRRYLAGLGVDFEHIGSGRRPLCRTCLDWSERRLHLGGALGAALLDLMSRRGWLVRGEGRVIRFNSSGLREFQAALA